MQELLAKIGIPAAVGTTISLVVVVVPMFFKIDERYAKQEAFEAEVQKLEKQNAELRAELAQAAGFQQAMVAFIQQGRLPRAPEEPRPVAAPAPAPAPSIVEMPVTGTAPPARMGAARPAPVEPVVVPVEKPQNWRELNEGLVRQQQRLSKD